MQNKMFVLQQAISKGYSLIPLRGGDPMGADYKKPTGDWKEYQNRRASLGELLQTTTNAFGIVTGPISGLLVLDVDGEDGYKALESYEMPATLSVKSRKGYHKYFQWVPELENKVTTTTGILPKVDVRGLGGFVVGWDLGSLVPRQSLAKPPQWLIDLLPNKTGAGPSPKKPEGWLEDALANLKEGNRNDTFTRIAGSLRSRGYSSDIIFDLLRYKAKEVGFAEGELRAICESVGRYPAGVRSDTEGDGDGNRKSLSEFLAQDEKVEWIVPGLIAKTTLAFIAGLGECGKTWMMMDLAIETAVGGTWLGKYATKPAKVLFIDQERSRAETRRRFAALIKGKGLDPRQLDQRLFLKCGSTIRINLPQSFDAFRKDLAETRPELIIVDSFATFHTSNPNDMQGIQDVIERLKALRHEFGCTFLFIYHLNKFSMADRKEGEEPNMYHMVGTVAIPNAAEIVFNVLKHEDGSMVYMTKNNLTVKREPFLVKITDMDAEKSKIQVRAY